MAHGATGVLWLHAGFHQKVFPYGSQYGLSTLTLRSFLSRVPLWGDLPNLKNIKESGGRGLSGVICFREDDKEELPPNHLLGDKSNPSLRLLEIEYSPWAAAMLGSMSSNRLKEFAGGPTGGGRGGDHDDNGGGGGGGGDDGNSDEYIFLLPFLTIAFAAFHLGYCAAVWMKEERPDYGFLGIGFALFCLLAISAIRINNRTGIDAYALGLGASVGVMIWTGERWFAKKEGSPAGVVSLFAACMSVMFTSALYHSL